MLRSVYRAYLNLKNDFSHLQERYSRAVNRCNSFSARLNDALAENKTLWERIRDYERVKRTFVPEEVERAVEYAKRWEAVEREKKKAKRKFDRGGR